MLKNRSGRGAAAWMGSWGMSVNSYRFARGKVGGELMNEREVKPCSLSPLVSVIPIFFFYLGGKVDFWDI